MSNTISASPATETSATDNGPSVSPLEDLITRARQASERMSASNPHRHLLADMAVALVAQARLVADLGTKLADKPRIIAP